MNDKILRWAAKQILINQGQSALPPYSAQIQQDFEPAAWSSFQSQVADFGTQLYVEAGKDAATRDDRPILITTADLAAALPRIIFRRAYTRRTPGYLLKLFIAGFGFLAGFCLNKASSDNAKAEWFAYSIISIIISLGLLVWDMHRETRP